MNELVFVGDLFGLRALWKGDIVVRDGQVYFKIGDPEDQEDEEEK